MNEPTPPQSMSQQLQAALHDTLAAPESPADVTQPRPPLVRSTVYVLRALVGLLLVLFGMLLLLVFDNALLGVREDFATIQQAWPGWLTIGIEAVIVLFIFIAIVGTNIFLLYRRKYRRWIMINLAALSALVLGAIGSRTVLALATSDALENAMEGTASAELGNDGLSAVVAVLTVGSVWIGPRLRPWAVGLVAAAASLAFVGASTSVLTLPFDIGIGILAGALVALILKTRDRAATAREVGFALEEDRIPVANVERADVDARGSLAWFVTTPSEDMLFVKTLDSDNRAADLMSRAYRTLRLRRAGDRRPFSSLRRSVEHEAFLSLASSARGIRTPQLVTVADVGSDGMLLAYRKLEGRSLDDVEPEKMTDGMLADVWRLVVTLHDAAIAHRDLRLANVFIAEDGVPWIIGLGSGELAASESLLARDYAQLLASTTVAVGADRAVAAAATVVGKAGIAEALPWIQPLALSSATRSQLGKSGGYAKLRAAAGAAAGVEVTYERIERVKPRTLFVLASVAIALYVLIPQLTAATRFLDELRSAHLGWVVVVAVMSALTYLGAGLGMVGAVPVRLPFWSVTMAQLASSFSNRVTPAKVGGMATNVRFLQKQDLTMPMAASAVGLNTVAGLLVHISLLVLAGLVASQDVALPVPDVETTAVVVTVLILVSGLIMILPDGRKLLTKYLLPAVRAGASAVAAIAKTPTKLLALFAGSAIITVSYTIAMIASLNAFGADVSVATAAVVYLAGAAVATAAPTPGGVGATEAALIAGYTVVGVEASTAFAAVLLFRLMTFWLPILPGWLALVWLNRSGRL
ncbi:MAG: lysylphosphatidylglycerol synthase transmembrane domain-containing protein [Acidimicrobiia bacterium]